MSDLFISHSSSDDGRTEELFSALKQQGYGSVFLDFDPTRGIPAGHDWEQELYRALRSCRAMLALCTRQSMASKWCFAEVVQAKLMGKPVFPVRLDDCEINDLLSSLQVIDLRQDKQAALERLFSSLSMAGLAPGRDFAWDQSRAPYPGLFPMTVADAAVFFGRDAEIQQSLEYINQLSGFSSGRCLSILGPSGVGKSSLLMAGVVARLKRETNRWIVVGPLRPGQRSTESLAIAFGKAMEAAGGSAEWKPLATRFEQAHREDDSHALESVFSNAINTLIKQTAIKNAHVVIAIDQSEELLAEQSNSEALSRLLASAEVREQAVFVLTLRSDFLAPFQRDSVLGEVPTVDFRIGPMNETELRSIIEKPASVAQIELEDGFCDALIKDASDGDALPLLAFTLRQLYDRFGNTRSFTLNEYHNELGGLSGAVARAADQVLKKMTPDKKTMTAVRTAFISLARINASGDYVRATAPLKNMPELAQPILQAFEQQRLIDFSRDANGDESVEAAHDALLRSWPTLKRWLDEDRAFLVWRDGLLQRISDWEAANRTQQLLLSGALLEQARGWQARRGREFDSNETAYIAASQKYAKRVSRRRRRIAFAIAGLLVGLAISAFMWRHQVQKTLIASAARDTTFLEVLNKAGIFQLHDVIDEGGIPGNVVILPGFEHAWTPLVNGMPCREFEDSHCTKPGDAVERFIVARSFGESSPGRILVSGHESLNFANGPFIKTALIWLQGEAQKTVGILSGNQVAIGTMNNHEGILIIDAMSRDLNAVGYEIRRISDLTAPGVLDDLGILVIANAWGGFSQTEIRAVKEFVRSGHGLLASGLGWSWRKYGPNLDKLEERSALLDIRDYPMNTLMAPFGLRWGGLRLSVPDTTDVVRN